jgi:hypothetical protein
MRSAQLLALLAATACSTRADKFLIEFGWDEPDTKFIRAHINEMQKTPFDGTVFHVNYRKKGKEGSFTWQAWGTNTFTREDVSAAIDDLQNTAFGRFTNNFLRFNTTPAKLDWFDDHTAVLNNARLAAQIAREGRCPGLLFDIEQYEGMLFDYRKKRDAVDKSKPADAPQKSWELYAAKARERGSEVMRAFQEGYPGLVVFLTFGYSLPWTETSKGRIPLSECHYGLLAPFLDGMLSAAEGNTLLVDGQEIAYSWKNPEQFVRGRQAMKEEFLPIILDPQKYARHFLCSFGIWMDRDWRKLGWNIEDPQKNYFTPDLFQTAVRSALANTDRYVWIYTETPRWWSDAGGPVKLPAAYLQALRQARSAP